MVMVTMDISVRRNMVGLLLMNAANERYISQHRATSVMAHARMLRISMANTMITTL